MAMRAKFVGLGVAVGVASLWAWANNAPRGQITVLYAEPNQPVKVDLLAVDPDGDPLEFELLDPPAVGTLLGAPPNLTYCPIPGFLGSVRISFRVRDPYGAFDVGWVEIRIAAEVTPLRILPKAPSNPVLRELVGFLVTQGVKTWYIADFEPRPFLPSVLPFFFVGGERKARVFVVGPAETPVLWDLGELRDHALWVDMRSVMPGLYFFLVLSGEDAFTYPVRVVHPLPDRKFAYAGS